VVKKAKGQKEVGRRLGWGQTTVDDDQSQSKGRIDGGRRELGYIRVFNRKS